MLDGVKSRINPFKMRFTCSIVSETGVGANYHGASELTSFYTPNYTQVATGISMTATNAATGGGPFPVGRQATLDILDLSISQSYSNATPGDVVTYVEFRGCRAIVMPSGVWRLTIAEIEWFVNGVSRFSSSAGWTKTSGMAPTGSSFPLWGIPPLLQGHSAVPVAVVLGCVGSLPSATRSASGRTEGGWEIEIDGVWVAAPIELYPRMETSGKTGTITAADCNSIVINHFETVSTGPGATAQSNLGYGGVWSMPNWDHDIVKMFPDYEELVYRGGFLSTQRFDTHTYQSFDCEGTEGALVGGTTYTEVYPLDTQFLSGVMDSDHVIENPISRTKYAPISIFGYEQKNWSSGYSTEYWLSGTWPTVDDSTMPSTYRHSSDFYSWIAEYMNSIVSPFDFYAPWLPKDTDSSAVRWDLFGADSDEAYWLANRQQFMSHPSLPGGENTERRVNIIAEPLDQNGYTGVTDAMLGRRCLWGVDLFQLSGEAYPADLTTNASSAPRFSTPTMGATVTVDASGITI